MIERKDCCPKCQSTLLARSGWFIFCLKCDWAVQKKRKSDDEIKEINQLKQEWQ
jgi:ribosomal protein L37AE/L43A